jgi:hypothetical protein
MAGADRINAGARILEKNSDVFPPKSWKPRQNGHFGAKIYIYIRFWRQNGRFGGVLAGNGREDVGVFFPKFLL